MKIVSAVLLVLLVFAFVGCDKDPEQTTCTCAVTEHDTDCACGADICNCTVKQYHSGMINAFDKSIIVKGDASIPAAYFETAKGKLSEAMNALDVASIEAPGARARYINMVNRSGFAIIIETGDASPDANAVKSMTIGIDYLLDEKNTYVQIMGAIGMKVMLDDAFAD